MKLFAAGDISPSSQNRDLFDNHDTDALFGNAAPVIKAHDFSAVNLECALTESDAGIEKFGPCLKAPVSTAGVLKDVGFDCCAVSNNHFFDFGKKGAADSLAAINKAGLLSVGFGKNYEDSRKNLVIEKNGERICIIAVCEHEYSYALPDRMGCRPYDVYDTPKDIRQAKKTADRVIVLYHGGKEHCKYPSPRLLKLCRNMADSGADLVLCQHSHCIGCYEEYNGCHIVYGQGNFLFHYDRAMPDHWYTALAVSYDTVSGQIEFIPTVHSESGVRLADGEDKANILNGFAQRNKELKNGEWLNGWHEFCESNRESYTRVIANAFTECSTELQNDHFGHYLDCEAHHDVWQELFKTANHKNER